MQNNPHKSRALIITFVIVLGLLIGGYFVFTSDTLFGVENSIGQKFSPFLTTPKEKNLNQIEDPNTLDPNGEITDTNNTNPDGTTGVGSGLGGVGNGSSGSITVTTSNFVPQCSDKIDNDADKLIDALDPGCHSDGDANNAKSYNKNQYLEYNFIPACNDGIDNDADKLIDALDPGCHSDNNAKNPATYTPNYTSEYVSQTNTNKASSQCNPDDLALVFTAEEQAELDELTRQFYRIAPTLKSTNDILIEDKAKQSYIDLVNNATTLTNECYAQTYNDKYLANSTSVVTEGFEALNTRYSSDTKEIDGTAYVIKTWYPFLNNQNGTLISGGKEFKESSSLSIPLYPYASLSGPDASGLGDKGRTERRGNPYISQKPVSSYWQIYETKQATRDPNANYYGNVYKKTIIGNKYFPWADWENMMGIW